jgi:hypothetical protein
VSSAALQGAVLEPVHQVGKAVVTKALLEVDVAVGVVTQVKVSARRSRERNFVQLIPQARARGKG